MPRKKRLGVSIHIGNNIDRTVVRDLVEVLNTRLEQAITLGRAEIGVEIVRRLGQFGDVNGATVSNCSFE